MANEHPDFCFVRHTIKGRIVLAASPLTAGQIIIREHPLVVVQDRWPESTYRAFREAPHEVQKEILGLYSPMTGLKAQMFKRQISEVHHDADEAEQELLLKVTMAFNQN